MGITKLHNKGAFLNLMEDKPKQLKILTNIFAVMLLAAWLLVLERKKNRSLKLGFTLMAAGTFSNWFDRAARGYVVDYFYFITKKHKRLNNIVFNLGDMAIFAGGILAAIGYLAENNK